MLIKDPQKRPSMKKILEKEFLSKRINKLLEKAMVTLLVWIFIFSQEEKTLKKQSWVVLMKVAYSQVYMIGFTLIGKESNKKKKMELIGEEDS